MIAWIAARNDAGRTTARSEVYKFPQDTSVLGPNQIAAKIDADPTISAQVTLWDQAGSNVIKGNLIVVPVQNSLIYLQPIYLQSANSAFPAFERIIVATPTRSSGTRTLAGALNQLLADRSRAARRRPAPVRRPAPSSGPTPTPTAGPGSSPPAGNVAALDRLCQPALRAGPDGPPQR